MILKITQRYIAVALGYRKWFYRIASTNGNTIGNYVAVQPVLLKGRGKIAFGENVRLGVVDSPLFFNTYAYLEARTETAVLAIGNNVTVNNQFTAVAESAITIKDNVLIGMNCAIYDSNFHDLNSSNRKNTDPHPKPVIIEQNVFIGNNVTILKGVTIGENCVVAAGSVVTNSFPANQVIGGNPAIFLKNLD